MLPPGVKLFSPATGSRSSNCALAYCRRDGGHQPSPVSRKPWWASSSVSVAIFGESTDSDGPVQRTGTTPVRFHVNTVLSSWFLVVIWASCGSTSRSSS